MKISTNIFYAFLTFIFLFAGCNDSKTTVADNSKTPIAHKINKQHVDNINFDDSIQYHINNNQDFLNLSVKNTDNNLMPMYHIDIDTNENSGYRAINGSEYLIEYNNLFRYSGNGGDWSWEYVATLDITNDDGTITTKVPKQLLEGLGDRFYSTLFVLDRDWNMRGQTSNVLYTVEEGEEEVHQNHDYVLTNNNNSIEIDNNANSFKLTHSTNNGIFHIGYFIDSDNNPNTGDNNGYDYIVEDNTIYNHQWHIIGTAEFYRSDTSLTTIIRKDTIPFENRVRISANMLDADKNWKYYVSGTIEIDANNNEDRTKKIFIIGDSTVKNPTEIGVGWGERVAQYMVNPENAYNLAQSGTSSKSYRIQDWRMTKEFMASKDTANGAYLLIHFGHNDETDEEHEQYMKTYPGRGNSFYNELKNYVVEARVMGITPVLMTPVERMEKTAGWELNHTHMKNEGDYAQTVRDLARDEGVLLLDLQDKSWRKFNTYRDKEELISVFGYGQDNSHFNSHGANVVAYWVKELICASGDQSFCSQFR